MSGTTSHCSPRRDKAQHSGCCRQAADPHAVMRGKMEKNLLPDRSYFLELKRPWKLASFSIGMTWLLYGALTYGISDWDVGISLLMGGLTYLAAPWSVRVILQSIKLRQRYWPLWIAAAIVVALFVIDGEYFFTHGAETRCYAKRTSMHHPHYISWQVAFGFIRGHWHSLLINSVS